MVRTVMCVAVLSVSALATPADAFQIETTVTKGCHEEITRRAVVAAGWPDGAEPPLPDHDDQTLIDDIPVQDSGRIADPWTAALILGVRYNDVHDRAPTDVSGLVHIHNDPEDQPSHCIRRREDDGRAGDAAAMAACRQFILDQLSVAIGDRDSIDVDATVRVELFLAFAGPTDVDLSRYAFHAGRALHALQDGYTHTFRDPGDASIVHVTNWIDYARSGDYDEAVDGYRHLGQLDDCTRTSEASLRRLARATDASWQLLEAIVDPTGGRAGRLARADAVLEAALAVTDRECILDNRYCDAGELDEPGLGCSVGGGAGGATAVLVVAVASWLLRRRRTGAAAIAVCCLLVTGVAHAQVAEPVADSLGRSLPGKLAAHFAVSASSDRGALAVTGGGRFNPSPAWGLGLDVEYNPWYSFDAGRFAPGLFNVYATAIYRHRNLATWELRSSVSAGTSVLLFDLVGVDAGSVGLYAGVAPLSVAFPLGKRTRVVVDPLSVSLPIPLVKGFPFFYRQYRVTIGLEWYL